MFINMDLYSSKYLNKGMISSTVVTTSTSSSSRMSSSEAQKDVPMEEVWTEQSIAVASGTSAGSPTQGAMARNWAPSGTEKAWYELIKEVEPELSMEVRKAECNAMKGLQFSSVRMFQAVTPVQLRDSQSPG